MDFFIGMVCLFAQNSSRVIPDGWVKCDGRLLQVGQYQALYAVIGNEFGGRAGVDFAVPKMSAVKTENGGTLEYYIVVQGLFPTNNN